MEPKEKALLIHLVDNEGMDRLDVIEDIETLMDDYRVLTDDESNEAVREYIEESLWAVRYEFLCAHSDAICDIPKDTWNEMVNKMYESANPMVKRLIDDFDHFIDDTIRSDGRGHFLSGYDGEEWEIKVDDEYFYVYRMN